MKKRNLARQSIVVALFTIALLLACAYLYSSSDISGTPEQVEQAKVSQKNLNIKPTEVPDGWSIYRSEDFGVTFAYPSSWTVQEQRVTEESNRRTGSRMPVGKLLRTIFTGDGYIFILNRDGHGLEDDSGQTTYAYVHYVVDGLTARAFENQKGPGYSQSIAVDGSGVYVLFSIISQNSKSKEIPDKILSTVNFYPVQ